MIIAERFVKPYNRLGINKAKNPIYSSEKCFFIFKKKVVAFDKSLCYNNFCPLRRGQLPIDTRL